MSKQAFADRLNTALEKEGFPPKNKGRIQLLAEMMGLTHRGASKWINGETSPPASKYPKLAEKLKVREEWLRTGEGEMLAENESPILATDKLIHVPVYTIEEFTKNSKTPIKHINCDINFQGEAFAIKLESEAMAPRFPSDSIVICDTAKEVVDGDFVLVLSKAYPAPIFRQFIKAGSTQYLSAHNPRFDLITLSDTDEILGVMVQAILNFS